MQGIYSSKYILLLVTGLILGIRMFSPPQTLTNSYNTFSRKMFVKNFTNFSFLPQIFNTEQVDDSHNENDLCHSSMEEPWSINPCDRIIHLKEFSDECSSKTSEQLFFIESAGNTSTRGRFACAVESAILQSELEVKFIFTSSYVNLSIDPNFCSLVLNYYPQRLKLFTMNWENLMKDTPQEGILDRWKLSPIRFQMIYLSDMIRPALFYKYGGFYADMDVITLKSLKSIKNSYGMEGPLDPKTIPESCVLPPDKPHTGSGINNGVGHFERGNNFVWFHMDVMNKTFDPKKAVYLTTSTYMLRSTVYDYFKWNVTSTINTTDFSILPRYTFMPFWNGINGTIWSHEDRAEDFWESYIKCSYMVHIINCRAKMFNVTGNPKREFYSYIGPKVCPKTFGHFDIF